MFHSVISQLSFFNDFRKENNDLVEGEKSKILINKISRIYLIRYKKTKIK